MEIHIPQLPATITRKLSPQEVGLVRQDAAAIYQSEIFCRIGTVGKSQEFQPGLFEGALPLALIAAPTSSNNIFPGVPASSRTGQNMVPRQLAVAEKIPTVEALQIITFEQGAIGQRWSAAWLGQVRTAHGNDARQLDDGTQPRHAVATTPQAEDRIAKRPKDQVAGIKTDRLAPAEPVDRLPSLV